MKTGIIPPDLLREIALSLDRADADADSLALTAWDWREVRACAWPHQVEQFARYARPCTVTTSLAAGSTGEGTRTPIP
jgi:hypothetical protein